MTWIAVILLALAAFALVVITFRLPRAAWTSVLCAVVIGLAGYGWQGSPGTAGAPRVASDDEGAELGDQLVSLRRQVMSEDHWGNQTGLITADAMARRGRFEYSAVLLRGEVEQYPNNAEAWLALGNTLVAHAGGAMTPAARMAYGKVEELAPGDPAVPFFLGLAELQEFRLLDARSLWGEARDRTAEGSEARKQMDERINRLDELLRRIVAEQQSQSAN